MNFSEFLKDLKTKRNFSSTREFFEYLGGEKVLGMTLRNFQLVEGGDRPPSEKVFRLIIKRIPREEYRNAVLSYFRSHMLEDCEEFLEFLDQHLSPPVNKEKRSLFESPRQTMMYSEEQLSYLTANADAARLHHRLMLWEKVSDAQLVGKTEIVENLVHLRLAERSGGGLTPSRAVYLVPSYENSSPSSVRKANRYIYSLFNNYLSEEGSHQQRVGFALQLVTKETANKILEQMSSLKRWIQSVAEKETHPDLVPFVYVSLAKKLEGREL